MWRVALARMSEVFSPQVLTRGQAYQRQGFVLNLRLSDGLLLARVKDNSSRIFNVYIDLKAWPDQLARCGCGQPHCEHTAASLFALKARNTGQQVTNTATVTTESRMEEEVLYADDVEWFSDAHEESHDFFSYQLGILINNKPVSIVPLVADLIHRWDAKTLESLSDKLLLKLPLEQGKVLKVELGRVKPLLRFLLHYAKEESIQKALKLKHYQLLLMQEAEQAVIASSARWQGTQLLQEQLKQLTALQLPDVTIPTGLNAELRDYQKQGLNWLQYLRVNQFGGILADDMGLGKTIQTLAHLLLEKEHNRLRTTSLIIAPTSLLSNWFNEVQKFTPSLKVLIYHGTTRHQDDFDDVDLIVTTYNLVQRDKKRFLDYSFYYLILDEAHFIKNARAKTTKIVQQLSAEHRLCLTGTPLENHLGELWSLFHFLMPGLLGTARQFRQYFRIPIERQDDEERRQQLVGRIKPFLLRRTKKEVARELPEKTEMVRQIELKDAQRDLYEAVRLSMEKKVRDAIALQGLNKSQIVLLDALLKLRQVCCDPRLLSIPGAAMAHGSSAKLEALFELLESLIEEERRVLVFSQFTTMLELIEHELIERQYRYLKLTGKTKNRGQLVEAFQAGTASVFLISLKAGGTGLNLTRADTVIHYDPWWNPAVEEQATDRSHRIGQENPVFVYKLISKGTVEEAITVMQEKKQKLVDGILSNSNHTHFSFSEQDIERFFAPLED